MIEILVIFNLIFSFLIAIIVAKIYIIYKRDYLFWFLFSIILIPCIFIYSFIEYNLDFQNKEILYPVIVILIEIMMITGEKKLLSSLKSEEREEYKVLLREDMMLLKTFERISNFFIGKIYPLVGMKNIREKIKECEEKFPILSGIYVDERGKMLTYTVEKNMEKIDENERIKRLCQSFIFLIERLVDMYSAFVSYEKIGEELRNLIKNIKSTKVVKWLTPFVILKVVIEPILRKCKIDDLTHIRISMVIEGINIGRNGNIEMHEMCGYTYEEVVEKLIKFINRLHTSLTRIFGENINKEITKNFRLLPNNVKEEIYRMGIIKHLPSGILEEEKITFMSREKLIEELAERKRKLEEAYKRLSEAKLDRMKANFINMIAHELRTPLTIIKTYVDLLLHEKLGRLNKMQKEKISRIAENIEKLEGLINDMLQIPSINQQELELRKENFYIGDVIKIIVDEYRGIVQEKRQKMTTRIDDSMVMGDIKLIEKAIKNVVSNSIKYTPEGGKIEIDVRKEGDSAHIIIKDNGPGIKMDEIEKIFEPFYTGEEGGVGLGLAITKSIIEGHGGRIWAESTPGKGSTFHIILKRIR